MTLNEMVPQVAYTYAFLLGEKLGAEHYATWDRVAATSKVVEVFARLVVSKRVERHAIKAFVAGWRASEKLAF